MESLEEVIGDLYTQYQPILGDTVKLIQNKGKYLVILLQNNKIQVSVENCKEIVHSYVDYYDYLMSLGDKRVETWGLMYSPLPTIAITFAYLASKSNYNLTKANYH